MESTETIHLILASASPRRGDLLREGGYDFEVIEPMIEEPDEALDHLEPSQQAEALAYFKARAVWETRPDCRVLGADTIVVVAGKVLPKPADRDQAGEILRTLSGTRHAVITGVALVGPDDVRLIASDVTYVTMRRMSQEDIETYLASGEWVGKAGAYAIQETADRFVEAVEGSFSNVVGLPLELTGRMMAELDAHPDAHKIT